MALDQGLMRRLIDSIDRRLKAVKKSTWLADKVLTIINYLHTDLAAFNCYGVVQLFKVVLILVRIRVQTNVLAL